MNYYAQLFKAVREDRLPKDFNRWEIANPHGKTVAHEAAHRRRLPPDFDRWALATKKGWTVAHEAAKYGVLPPDFTQWGLTDQFNRSVALIAELHANPRKLKTKLRKKRDDLE
jgi:hypothetical protein